MRTLASAALVLFLATGSVWAQRGGGMRGGGGFRGGGGGFRGGGFHGGMVGGHRGFVGGGFHHGGFNRGFVGFNKGFHGGHIGFGKGFGFHKGFHGGHFGFGFGKGFGFHRGLTGFWHSRGFYLPYSYTWPVYPVAPYYGSSYVYDYSLGYPPIETVTPPDSYAQPPVVISQQYASPVIRETSPLVRPYVPPATSVPAESGPSSNGSSVVYLLAFTDNVIRPAVAYWVDGNTLHYVGMDRKQRQAPLSTIDRDLSRQLNRERGVPFRLPSNG